MLRRIVLAAVLLAAVAVSLLAATGDAAAGGYVWCRNCTNVVALDSGE